MTYKIMKIGDKYQVASEEAVKTFDKLPAQNYTVKFDKMSESFYLEAIDPFKIPSKVYGDTERMSARILYTFDMRPNVTGVLLEGNKGSGKTLLAKYVATRALEIGIPTIVVNQPFHGDVFNQFIQSIGDDVIIIMDEFEKVYNREQQEKVLTLLDGVFPSKKLFFLTINSMGRFNEHMLNRPGRIYYNLNYSSLSGEFIREYCEDNLLNKDNIQDIVTFAKVFTVFNFDMLQAAVEEMNRYDETFNEVIAVLNIAPEDNNFDKYTVTYQIDNLKPVVHYTGYNTKIQNPDIYVDVSDIRHVETNEKLEEALSNHTAIYVDGSNLVEVNTETDSFIYHTTCGSLPVTVVITREDPFAAKKDPISKALGMDVIKPTFKESPAPLTNAVREVKSLGDFSWS